MSVDLGRAEMSICLRAPINISENSGALEYSVPTQQKIICYMRCVNAFFIDITNIFVNMTDFSCHFNQKDTLRIPNECLCVILTY